MEIILGDSALSSFTSVKTKLSPAMRTQSYEWGESRSTAVSRQTFALLSKTGLLFFLAETIGDAYCVAGGLHRKINTHAQQIAWLALRMISGETQRNGVKEENKPSSRCSLFLRIASLFSGNMSFFLPLSPQYCIKQQYLSVKEEQ